MALWFKKKPEAERVLEYNVAKLKAELQTLSSRLYPLKNEFSVHIIREVIEMARNVQILEVNRYKTEQEFWVHHGRLSALSDLSHYIERSLESRPVKEDSHKSRDAIRAKPRAVDAAGAAL